MKIGDKVRFQLSDKKYESRGTVLKINEDNVLVGVGEPHYFNYEERELPRRMLKVFYQMSDEDFEQFHADMLSTVHGFAKHVFQEMLPGVAVDIQDGIINADGFTLEPCIVEVRSISTIREVAGWSVSAWSYSHGDRDTPPDVDQISLGEFVSYYSAVIRLAEAVFGEKVRRVFESVSIDVSYTN